MKKDSGKVPLIVSIEELKNLLAWISHLAEKVKKEQEKEILSNSINFLNTQVAAISEDSLETQIFIPLSECLLYKDYLSIKKEELFDNKNPLREIRASATQQDKNGFKNNSFRICCNHC